MNKAIYSIKIIIISLLLSGAACSPHKYYSSQSDVIKGHCFRNSEIDNTIKLLSDGSDDFQKRAYYSLGLINEFYLQGDGAIYKHLIDSQTYDDYICDFSHSKNQENEAESKYSNIGGYVNVASLLPNQSTATEVESSQKQTVDIQNDLTLRTDITITSSVYSLEPAQRLEKVVSVIVPVTNNLHFIDVESDQLEKTADHGTTETTVGATLNAPLGFNEATAITGGGSFSQKTTRKILRRYVTKNVFISPLRNVAMVFMDGGPLGADVSGNTTTTLQFTAPPSLCQYINTAEYHSGKLKKLTPQCYIPRVLAVHGSLMVVRDVLSGEKTIQEDDDKYQSIVLQNANIFELWRNPKRYYYDKESIHCTASLNSPDCLFFSTPQNAVSYYQKDGPKQSSIVELL